MTEGAGAESLDKNALLRSGKYFGRIFLTYLMEHAAFRGPAGKEMLAHELLTLGQAERQPERSELEVKALINMRFGRQKLPYWINYAAMRLCFEHGFTLDHPADSVAVAATVVKDYQDDYSKLKHRELNFAGFLDYIDNQYRVTIPSAHQPIVRAYLESRRYELH